MTAERERFDRFVDELVAWARTDPTVIGVVGMGSTGDRSRVDEWSDHDVAVVTEPGAQERLRGDLAWLPNAFRLVSAAREHHNGFKAFDAEGRVIEFAVVDRDELLTFAANDYAVLYERDADADADAGAGSGEGEGVVAGWMRQVHDRTIAAAEARPRVGDDAILGVFLTQLLVGVGRLRRGELLSGAQVIRAEAEESLLDLIRRRLPPAEGAARDSLDPRRRFERSYPDEAALIAAALSADAESAARSLLEIVEQRLAPTWPEFPGAAVTAVRRRLDWI